MAVLEDLTEDEAYLWAILSDPSGLDQAEFTWYDPENNDGCFRAWPFQWKWWRCEDPKQIDQCSRAVGKSKSIQVRACAFPLLHPRQEMVVTAPEGVHLDAVTDNIETQITSTRLLKSLLQRERGKSAVKHKPFHVNFANGSRIMGRIPQRDGKGMKGCVVAGTHILAESGHVVVEDLKPGDLILVDSGEWLPISRIDVDVNESYKVVGQSSFPLTVSCDHRFLGSSNLAGPKQTRQLEKLYYHDVEDILDDNVYWASPTRFAPLPIPHLNYGPTSNKLEINESFWWLVGRYLADGHLSSNKGTEKRVCFSVHPKSLGEFTYHSNRVGVHVGRKRRSHSSADELTISSAAFFNWLESYFGRLSHAKIVPGFVFGMDAGDRLSFLDGYLKGDGTYEPHKNKWISGSASKALTMSIQLIAQSVGLKTTTWMTTPKVKEICGVKLVSEPRDAWYVSISLTGHQLLVEDHALVSKVKSVDFVGKQKVYNPIVNGNHSYVSNTIISHNTHPIWLELDEGQDYPEPGWKETIETLKRGSEGAVWRAHGVTRGVRDVFYRLTQPNSGWTTHRFTAMHRPNWTDQEREEKIMDYGGSRDHPDYKRNILGLHGDATNPLFVLHRLMACVDQVKSSEYNTDVYYERKISDEELSDGGGHIANLINLPGSHKGLSKTFWVGMDVGFTNHPSEVLVFGEISERKLKAANIIGIPDDGPSALPKGDQALILLTRLKLDRISHPHQVDLIDYICNYYNVQAFSMDKTGNGLPLFQDAQHRSKKLANVIKGYNFSEKILVDFDLTVDVDEFKGDLIEDSGIKKNVLEYSSDVLRDMVDNKRIVLPFDRELIAEFEGQTYFVVRDTMNQYGKREFSKGQLHALDAAKMAVLGMKQNSIEEFTKQEKFEPVMDIFFG